MGAGKRPVPGKAENRGRNEVEDGEPPLTVAELVSELLYAGKTRAEIAGYDDLFTRWVLCRRRDENGSLVRVPDDLPAWVSRHLDSRGHWTIKDSQSYSSVFRDVKAHQGLSEQEQRTAWQLWRRENPGYGAGGE